jgi:hypothetical protein
MSAWSKGIEGQLRDEVDLAFHGAVPDTDTAEPAIDVERLDIEMRDAVPEKPRQVLDRLRVATA